MNIVIGLILHLKSYGSATVTCVSSASQRSDSQEWVSASSQPPFPGEGFVKSLVRKMQMVKVEMSHSGS